MTVTAKPVYDETFNPTQTMNQLPSAPSIDLNEISPWPPVLNLTPEVESGIAAAAALAFGPNWDVPMNELSPEEIVADMLRMNPNIAQELLAFATEQPLQA